MGVFDLRYCLCAPHGMVTTNTVSNLLSWTDTHKTVGIWCSLSCIREVGDVKTSVN